MPRLRNLLIIAVTLTITLGGSSFAIERVAAKFGVLEFRGSYGMPQGDYDGIPGLDFVFDDTELVKFDAQRVYDDGFSVGMSYGQIVGGHWLMSIGLDYAQHKIKNPILQEIGAYQYSISFTDDPTYHQFDLSLRGGYVFNNLVHNLWSPYFGIGASAGLSSVSAPEYEADREFDFGMSLDFGLDFKVWEASDKRTFVTLSSINRWDFLASGDRVSLLQVGGGIKYYFKP